MSFNSCLTAYLGPIFYCYHRIPQTSCFIKKFLLQGSGAGIWRRPSCKVICSRKQQQEQQVTIHLMGVPPSGLLILLTSQALLPGTNIPGGIKTIKCLTPKCKDKGQRWRGGEVREVGW